jgi:MFS family permease
MIMDEKPTERQINNNNVGQTFVAEAEVGAPEPGLVTRTWASFKRVFYSLKYRDYAILWLGGWFSNIGTWIQNVAIGWLVYKLTNSSVSLGIINFSSSIPVFFLSFYAGAVVDRFSKKWIVFWGNFVPMLFAFLLGFLVGARKANMEVLVVLSFASGVAAAFAFPAWQSFISELVPKKDLMNAIALNSVQFHASRLIGPAAAGFLVAELGLDWAFYINGISFFAVLLALLLVKDGPTKVNENKGWLREVREGFAYLKRKPVLIWYMVMVALIGVFGIAYLSTLMPIYAGNILKVQAKEFGILVSSNGFGGLLGALFVAWISGRKRPEEIVRWSLPLSAAGLIFLSFTKNFYVAVLALFLMGAFFLATNSTLNTAIQSSVDHAYRGRVMSIFVWMFMGLSPFGALLGGFFGRLLGINGALAVAGLAALVLGMVALGKIKHAG